jgi:hypothetical protein
MVVRFTSGDDLGGRGWVTRDRPLVKRQEGADGSVAPSARAESAPFGLPSTRQLPFVILPAHRIRVILRREPFGVGSAWGTNCFHVGSVEDRASKWVDDNRLRCRLAGGHHIGIWIRGVDTVLVFIGERLNLLGDRSRRPTRALLSFAIVERGTPPAARPHLHVRVS